jgi:hypothetical protein
MIWPNPDSVTMYMHIIGINFSKDETKEFENWRIYFKKTLWVTKVFFYFSYFHDILIV